MSAGKKYSYILFELNLYLSINFISILLLATSHIATWCADFFYDKLKKNKSGY